MGSGKLDFHGSILIGRDGWEIPIRVSVESYREFCSRIERGLSRLEARWAHAAAPNTRRTRQRRS